MVEQLASAVPARHSSVTALVALLAAVAIWGGNFFVVKEAVTAWHELPFIAVRFWIATLAFLPFVAWDRILDKRADGRAFRTAVTAGASLFVAYVLQAAGLKQTSVTNGAFLTALFVVFVPLLQTAICRRVPPVHELVSCVVASAGTAILVGGSWTLPHRADVLVIGSAVMYACQIVIVGKVPSHMRSIDFTAIQLATIAIGATVAFVPAAVRGAFAWPPGNVLVYAVFSGLVASSLAYFLQAFAQRRVAASQAAVIFTLEPVFAVLIGVAVAREMMPLRTIAGGAIIVAATILCTHPYFIKRGEPRQ